MPDSGFLKTLRYRGFVRASGVQDIPWAAGRQTACRAGHWFVLWLARRIVRRIVRNECGGLTSLFHGSNGKPTVFLLLGGVV